MKKAWCLTVSFWVLTTSCRTTGVEIPGPEEERLESSDEGNRPTSTSSSGSKSVGVQRPNELQLQQTCDRPVDLRMTAINLDIPARSGCSFGEAPHLSGEAGRNRAFATTSLPVPLPSGRELCSVFVRLETASFRYQDGLQLWLQSHVIFSSEETWIPLLPKEDGVPLAKPELLLNQAQGEASKSWCEGAKACTWPVRGVRGPVLFERDIKAEPLLRQIKADQEILLTLAVWGDQDFEDCSHEELKATLFLYTISK